MAEQPTECELHPERDLLGTLSPEECEREVQEMLAHYECVQPTRYSDTQWQYCEPYPRLFVVRNTSRQTWGETGGTRITDGNAPNARFVRRKPL